MKQFIKHRVNTIDALHLVESTWGAEIDLRSHGEEPGGIHLSHDPWKRGDNFREWLKVFKAKNHQGPLILNTKEDGLEDSIIELMKEFRIESYFFLDTTAPTLVKKVLLEKNKNFAVRYSRYEPAESVEVFKGSAEWLWVDCFNGIPVSASEIAPYRNFFRICLVSPEMHGSPLDTISLFSELYPLAHAICTKQPEEWLQRFK